MLDVAPLNLWLSVFMHLSTVQLQRSQLEKILNAR